MSLCAICRGRINDGFPYDDNNLGYDGCEHQDEYNHYENR